MQASERPDDFAASQLDEDSLPRPKYAADRDSQISEFIRELRRIHQQSGISHNLFEWYGGPGIGKSVLVDLLLHQCEKEDCATILVNFRDPRGRSNSYLTDPVELIKDMVCGLSERATLSSTFLTDQIASYEAGERPLSVVYTYADMSRHQRLYTKPEWLVSLRQVVNQFLKLVADLLQGRNKHVKPVVVFFDETEYADPELIDWIEEWLINPLVQMERCLVVWTARRPWRWKRPETRRRLRSEQLEVFDQDDVKKQFQMNSSHPDLAPLLFKNVHLVTGGHPFANAVVISELDHWTASGQRLTPENFVDHQPDLLGEIFSKFILDYAFRDLDAELKTACELLAMVRVFDTTMLRALLSQCGGQQFETWDPEDYGDLMLRLRRTQLLVWEKGNALDPDLRHIIQGYMLSCERKTYIKANRVALQVYQDWLNRDVDNRTLFILEELYHKACLHSAGEVVDVEAEFEVRLKQYPDWIADSRALRHALEQLEGGLANDRKLAQLTEGLSDTELVEMVREFLASMPISNTG